MGKVGWWGLDGRSVWVMSRWSGQNLGERGCGICRNYLGRREVGRNGLWENSLPLIKEYNVCAIGL